MERSTSTPKGTSPKSSSTRSALNRPWILSSSSSSQAPRSDADTKKSPRGNDLRDSTAEKETDGFRFYSSERFREGRQEAVRSPSKRRRSRRGPRYYSRSAANCSR